MWYAPEKNAVTSGAYSADTERARPKLGPFHLHAAPGDAFRIPSIESIFLMRPCAAESAIFNWRVRAALKSWVCANLRRRGQKSASGINAASKTNLRSQRDGAMLCDHIQHNIEAPPLASTYRF